MQARVLHRLQPALQARGQVWAGPGVRQDGPPLPPPPELPLLPEGQRASRPTAITQGITALALSVDVLPTGACTGAYPSEAPFSCSTLG